MKKDFDNFSGFKTFEAFTFTKERFLQLTAASKSLSQRHASDPSQRIAALLQDALKCSTILVEKGYIDRDFKAEFSAFYSKRFYIPQPRCDRLHFFSTKITLDTFLFDVDHIENESYLGYCIVRPTEFNRIGRTVISTPRPNILAGSNNELSGFVTCQTRFVAHVLGRQFQVFGSPFVQQDTQVGACAHAALWMVARYMSTNGFCHEFLPPEINILANSRQPRGRSYPAENGLVPLQILDALRGMELSAIHYNRQSLPDAICSHIKRPSDGLVPGENEYEQGRLKSKKLADLAYRYVESRLPIILTTEDHAIVGIGHTFSWVPNASNNIDRIPSIIVNDDGKGPYLEISVQKSGAGTFDDVRDVIAVLPKSVMLRGEYAEEAARSALELAPSLFSSDTESISRLNDLFVNSVFRTYLVRSTELQQDLLHPDPDEYLPDEVIDALRLLDLPQYVWISEIYRIDQQSGCIGKIVIDSTAAKSDRSVISMIVDRIAILFDRRAPDSAPLAWLLPQSCQLRTKPMTRSADHPR